MALAATTMLGGGETLIGVARYVLENHQTAEFAIVVADAWQGRGIGRRLLAKLIEVARRRGVRRLYGEILRMNRQMLELVQNLGFNLGPHQDPTLSRATLQL